MRRNSIPGGLLQCAIQKKKKEKKNKKNQTQKALSQLGGTKSHVVSYADRWTPGLEQKMMNWDGRKRGINNEQLE